MKDVIDIFNDIVKLGEAVMASEKELADAINASKMFLDDFKSGNVEKAQEDCEKLGASLEGLGLNFETIALEPLMDIYQKIKNVMHLHIDNSEKQLLAFEQQSCLKSARYILEKMEGKVEQQA
ncbi:MAG: hypothetical protein CL833_05960 [Crocinitomicaceae bacterium]|nr:hypothetical protein [Crocinitomicaceae bacterium]|tara:strand:+ start:288 stop:656 length:369 start_codon:yes stop_codon:yes gene_type:complete